MCKKQRSKGQKGVKKEGMIAKSPPNLIRTKLEQRSNEVRTNHEVILSGTYSVVFEEKRKVLRICIIKKTRRQNLLNTTCP